MKTPKEYKDLLNQNQITNEILGQVLYSIDKRYNLRLKKDVEVWENHEEDPEKTPYSESERVSKIRYKYINMLYDMLELITPVSVQERVYDDTFLMNIAEYMPGFDIPMDDMRMYDKCRGEYFPVKHKKLIDTFYSSYSNEYRQYECTVEEKQYYYYYKVGSKDFYMHITETEMADYKRVLRSAQEKADKYGIKIEPYTLKGISDWRYTNIGDTETDNLLSHQFCNMVYEKFTNKELEIIE